MISLHIHVDTASDKWKRAFPKMKRKIEQATAAAFVAAKRPAGFSGRNFEIAVVLTDDKTIKDLNHTYRGKKEATNVLSFPQFDVKKFRKTQLKDFPADDVIPLGDVVVAWQTVKRECKEQKKDLEDHVIHLVVHGTLHILGYDHMKAKEAKTMESLECDILESLGYPDPYHEPVLETRRS
ncbi:MAG: rRNA maturation RNase YbeY [Alphaproteobacteria bacterium]|nr:rRNA maturation RNase YbeY [Alphaproteobacteria bacterium]